MIITIYKKAALSICLLMLLISHANAKHIIGGELSYKSLGNNNYEFTLKLFRDCSDPTGAAYDNPTVLTVFDTAGNFIDTLTIAFPGAIQVPISSQNGCLTIPPNLCIQEADFIIQANLPPIPGGYIVVYQRCCRNNTMVNSVSNEGATYVAFIPDSSLAYNNNSPVFNTYPPIAACVNSPLSVDQSATDPDGDSLSYSLYTPFSGADAGNTYPIPANFPFANIVYAGGYNGLNPMGILSPVYVDAKTGLLTVTPAYLGQFVVGICAKEYRKGKLIGTHYRDFQFNIVNCINTGNVVAAFTSSDSALTISFNSNSSIGAANYTWNFGDGTTDTVANPVHTYSIQGSYNVCLTVHNDSGCTSTQCRAIVAGSNLGCDAFFTYYRDTITPHHWYIVNESTGKAPVNYTWEWGDGTSSTGETPSHTYTQSGSYAISLKIADDTACTSIFNNPISYFYRLEDNTPVTVTVIKSVITAISPVGSLGNLFIRPNPCMLCEVKGVNNATDFTVTDLLGRNINVRFTKTTSGSVINFIDNRTGIFLLRNIRTGEVVKFIHQL